MLNTDNMSIVGVTVDYGPYGFMDIYDPGKICNGSGKPFVHGIIMVHVCNLLNSSVNKN